MLGGLLAALAHATLHRRELARSAACRGSASAVDCGACCGKRDARSALPRRAVLAQVGGRVQPKRGRSRRRQGGQEGCARSRRRSTNQAGAGREAARTTLGAASASSEGRRRKLVAQVAQQNRAPLIQQFTNQARPLLRAELIFARNVCHLNREELRKVNQDAQQMLDEVVTKLVDAQFQPRARQCQVTGRTAPSTISMPSSFFWTAWSRS